MEIHLQEHCARIIRREIRMWAIIGIGINVALRLWGPVTGGMGSANHNNVRIGADRVEERVVESHAEFLTVERVAEKEDRSARCILDWIRRGYIVPAPVKTARAWRIDPNYAVVMPDPEDEVAAADFR